MATHFSHDASGGTMRYNSRCEKFVLRFLNNLQNIKSQRYFRTQNLFLFYKFFLKNSIFQENCGKTVLVAHLTIFQEKDSSCPQTLNINFLLPQIRYEVFAKRQKFFGNLKFLIKHVVVVVVVGQRGNIYVYISTGVYVRVGVGVSIGIGIGIGMCICTRYRRAGD